MKRFRYICATFLALAIVSFATINGAITPRQTQKTGYVIETDTGVALPQPGPHDGGGETTGYSFFSAVADLDFVFRKRALHPGAAIGYHEQDGDEVYYVLSGAGELTMNGVKSVVGTGTAILTRTGSSHGLRQTGADDLVIIIVYRKDASAISH
jgi:mannose-6-phosphate isomerase-like protein (cupin superfamily)